MILYVLIAILMLIISVMTWFLYLLPRKKTLSTSGTLKDLKEEYIGEYDSVVTDIDDNASTYDACKVLLEHIESLTDKQKILETQVQENKKINTKVSEGLEQKSHEIVHISHQMRTSLSGLLGFTHFLQSSKLDEEQEEFVSIIATSSDELLTLVNSIIDMTPTVRTDIKQTRERENTVAPKNKIPYVLVVDDNTINKRLLAKVLENENLNVTYASDGVEALSLRKDNHFDVIFMDIQMPVMDGVEASKAIRSYEKENNISPVPIIALTANTGKNDRDTYLDAGMTDYMAKPIMIEEVRKRIAQL